MARYIISFIFIATAVAVFFAWTQHLFEEIKVLRANEKALNEALAKSKELQGLRDELISKYNSINKDDIDALNKLFPSHANSIKIALEIENIATKHNLLFKNIAVQNVSSPPGYSSMAIENINTASFLINVSGSYKSFIAFLGDLEKSLRPMEIENLTFSSGSTDSYEYNLSGLTYYYNVSE